MAIKFNHSQNLSSGAAIGWDFNLGNIANVTLDSNGSLTLLNQVENDVGVLLVTQDGTGNRTLELPGNPPPDYALSPGPAEVTLLTFIFTNGTFLWQEYPYGTIIQPDSFVPIDFPNEVNLLDVLAVWRGTNSTAFNNYGVSDQVLTGDGAMRIKIANTDANAIIFGLKLSNAVVNYTGYEKGVYIDGGFAVSAIVGGVSTGIGAPTATIGEFYYIRRVGSTFTIEVTTDNVSFTTLYTFPGTSSATHYPSITIFSDSSHAIYYPEGDGLS